MSKYLSRREFRPVPFRRIQDIRDVYSPLEDVIKSCLNSGKVLIQDSIDMKVEEFTVDELGDFEQNKGVSYSCITSVDYEDGSGNFVVLDEFLDVCGDEETKYFLNNTLSVTCKSCDDDFSRYLNDIDVDGDSCQYDVYSLRVGFKQKVFDLKIAYAGVFDGITGLNAQDDAVLLVNNKPVCHLNTDNFDLYQGIYFELVQICKSKLGFDLVLFFPSSFHSLYLGLRLSKDLSLVSVVNFDDFVDTSSISKEYFDMFAKSKILN